MLKADVVAAFRGTPENRAERDVLLCALQVSVWAGWAIALVAGVLPLYRPEFWYLGHPKRPFLLLTLVVVTGLPHSRLLPRNP